MESRTRLLKADVGAIRVVLLVFVIVVISLSSSQWVPSSRRMNRKSKRSFATLKCLGAYDRSAFAKLNHVCDECYQLYRDQHIHTACRNECFQNDIFLGCVDALLLSQHHKTLKQMVDQLSGK